MTMLNKASNCSVFEYLTGAINFALDHKFGGLKQRANEIKTSYLARRNRQLLQSSTDFLLNIIGNRSTFLQKSYILSCAA